MEGIDLTSLYTTIGGVPVTGASRTIRPSSHPRITLGELVH